MSGFEMVQARMDALGVQAFGADLPGGRIHWMDARQAIVVHGRCKVIVAYLPAQRMYFWMSVHGQYQGLPKVMKPVEAMGQVGNVSEEEVRAVALAAAMADNAQYLYAAPAGGGSTIYLAVYDLQWGGLTLSAEEQVARSRSTMQYVVQKVDQLLSAQVPSEFDPVLYAFVADLRMQHDFVLKGIPSEAMVGGFVRRLSLAMDGDGGEASLRIALQQVRMEALALLQAMG